MSNIFSSLTKARRPSQDSLPQDIEDGSLDKPVELDANDLCAFLNISRDEAEEMIFLADQDDIEVVQMGDGSGVQACRTIDREEFQQLIKSWS